MNSSQLALLKTRRFLPIFITQFLGALNDNIFKNALVILINYRLATLSGFNSQLLVTAAGGIFILPFFLFSATAGQLADSYEKSRLISMIKLIEIGLMIAAALGFYLQNMALLMLVLFCLGTHATFFGPLKYAVLPEQLKENELIGGNGLIEAGTFLSILLGTIVGGICILQHHGEWIISSLTIIMAVTGWLASLYIPKTSYQKIKINFNVIKETFELIKYSRNHSTLFLSILGISWFWVIGSTFVSEFPIFVKETLHADQSIVTLFFALFSIGLAIGSLLCNKLLKGKVHATCVPFGALGMSFFILDLYFASITQSSVSELMNLKQFIQTFSVWRIMLDLVFIAICGGVYTVPLYAMLQQHSPKEHCARVIASNNVLNALFMVVAAMATMTMLKLSITIKTIFLVMGSVNAIVALYICKLLPDVFIRGFFRWILKALYRVELKGLENYYAAGERVVIIANHTSFLDALLLAVFLPDKLTFAVNKQIARKTWVRFFLRLVEAYPLDPANPMAVKSLIEYVKQNKRCVIFPEGRLTVTGALMKIYEGPGLIADKSGGKLLPICIEGARLTPFSRLRGKGPIRLMPKITITVFPPKDLQVSAEIKGRKRRQQVGYKLYDVMTNMMFSNCNIQKTLFSSLIEARAMHGSRHKVLEDSEREPISYQQLIMRSFILGSIIAKSTQPGEVVGILLPNMVSTVITFFGLQAYGRIPAMLNYSTGINNMAVACHTAQIKEIYTSRKFIQLAKLQEMVVELQKNKITINYLEDLRASITFWDKMRGFVRAQFPRFYYKRINHRTSDSAAVILFTSGSEGAPKGVVLSHSNLQSNRYQLSVCVDFNANDKILNALPIFHSFGLTAGLLLPLLSGLKLFLYPSPLHYRIVPELSYDINATILFGTDTFLSGYAKHAHPYDFFSVRYVFAGAEALKNETYQTWSKKFGVRILEGYGATETSPALAINTSMQNKVGTVGRMLPGIQYQLDSVAGIQGGKLKVFGPNIMQGYLLANQPGVIVPPLEGWYDTGDIVELDEAGFMTIKGRVKRFAKIAGEMVSLTMVEQKIQELWPNAQHAVISIPDIKKGEQIILITTQHDAKREEVISFNKRNLIGEIMIPRKIICIKTMPLLGSGKINYSEITKFINNKCEIVT